MYRFPLYVSAHILVHTNVVECHYALQRQYIVHTNVKCFELYVLYNVGVTILVSICTNTIRIMDGCALFSPSYFSGIRLT